ncbi:MULTISPECIES: arylsulfatase [Chitinophagaceae]
MKKMLRCARIKLFVINVLVIAPLIGISQRTIKKGEHAKPNIVYILADDLGYGDLGCYGQSKVETPNIDALAMQGMLFTQHYAEPLCAPSRYALMTGKDGGAAYIRGNHEWGERGNVWDFRAMEENPALEGQLPIPDSTITVAKLLQKAGYKTAMVGKWGLGSPMTTGVPNRQGFDYFFGSICQRQDHQYYSGHLWENELRVYLDNKVVDPNYKLPDNLDPSLSSSYIIKGQNDYSPDLMVNAALKYIKENKSTPFFLYYPTPLPHASMQAPQRLVDYYHKKFGEEKPYLGGGYVPCQYPRATRAAMVALLDEQVGLIVKELKAQGIYDNTVIMVAGDNGPSNEGGADCAFFNSGGPFLSAYGRGKGFLYEGGIRIPFIASWKGKIQPGQKSDLPSSFWDFLPTVCELVKIKTPQKVDGISFLPTLFGIKDTQIRHPYLYWELADYDGQQAVRLGQWKGIRFDINKGNMHLKLFDLENDIQELHDVAALHPDIVAKMEQIMAERHHKAEVSRFWLKGLDF